MKNGLSETKRSTNRRPIKSLRPTLSIRAETATDSQIRRAQQQASRAYADADQEYRNKETARNNKQTEYDGALNNLKTKQEAVQTKQTAYDDAETAYKQAVKDKDIAEHGEKPKKDSLDTANKALKYINKYGKAAAGIIMLEYKSFASKEKDKATKEELEAL